METKLRHILAVIDPTRNEQWALSKAISIAAGRPEIKVTAYACIYSYVEAFDPDALQEADELRHRLWLDKLINDMDTRGVGVSVRVDWDRDWREAIHHAAEETGANLVIKAAGGHSGALGGSDRRLLRTVNGDVLLVNREPSKETRRVLLALNPNSDDERHRRLDDTVVSVGKRIKELQPQVELHAVSAYPDSLHYIDPRDLAKKAGVDERKAHTQAGPPARVIPEVASDVESDIVIIGTVARRGVAGVAIGNTAEKVLGAMRSDVLVVREHA